MANADFYVYQDKQHRHRLRLVATNGRTIARSVRAYASGEKALDDLNRAMAAPDAAVTFYKDRRGEHRFRWYEGDTTTRLWMVSSEGYVKKADCEHGAALLREAL